MKVPQLKELLRARDIPVTGKNKAELIRTCISSYDPSAIERNENKQVYKLLVDNDREQPVEPGEIYRQNFNSEDLMNRQWYKIDKFITVTSKAWTARFLWGMIRISQANSYWFYKEQGGTMELVEFRKEWALLQIKNAPRRTQKRKRSE